MVPAPKVTGTGRRTSRKILRLHTQPKNEIFGTMRYACSNIEGGKEAFVDYLRIAANAKSEVAARFVAKWDSLSPSEQEACSLDDVAESMELSVPNLIGTAVSVMARMSHDTSKMLASLAQPRVVEALIDSASAHGKVAAQDRKTFLTATGFLPSKQGMNVKVAVNQQNNNNRDDNSGNPKFENVINTTARVLQGDDE